MPPPMLSTGTHTSPPCPLDANDPEYELRSDLLLAHDPKDPEKEVPEELKDPPEEDPKDPEKELVKLPKRPE